MNDTPPATATPAPTQRLVVDERLHTVLKSAAPRAGMKLGEYAASLLWPLFPTEQPEDVRQWLASLETAKP